MFFHDGKEHGMKNLFQHIMNEMSFFSHGNVFIWS